MGWPMETTAKESAAEAVVAAPEPGTPRALWPTFLRRTLAEDMLQPPPPRPVRPNP